MHLRREDFGTSRFQMALRLLTDHLGIEFEGVRFNLMRDGTLLCSSYIRTPRHELLQHDVVVEINRAQAMFVLLCQRSQAFHALAEWARPVFSVVADYGQGAIEICRLENGKLDWMAD